MLGVLLLCQLGLLLLKCCGPCLHAAAAASENTEAAVHAAEFQADLLIRSL